MAQFNSPSVDQKINEEIATRINADEVAAAEEFHNETSPHTKDRTISTKSGFTGASTTATQMLNTTDQVLLRSAKLEAKRRGDAARTLFSNLPENQTSSSLLGPTFRPAYTQNVSADRTQNLQRSSGNFRQANGYFSAAPWSSDLSKINIPKLKIIEAPSIVAFQIGYKRYFRAIRELEERYGTTYNTSQGSVLLHTT